MLDKYIAKDAIVTEWQRANSREKEKEKRKDKKWRANFKLNLKGHRDA